MVVHIDPTKYNRTCPRCQATVHGTDVPTCPECSGSMIPACMGCGYDLAGLPRDGLCPECSTPVEKSYAPDLLENRSVAFLLQLHSGLGFVVWGILAKIVLSLGVFLMVVIVMAAPTANRNFPVSYAGFKLITHTLDFGLSLLVLVGWWRITTPDPARVGTDLDIKPRQILRITVVFQAAAELAALVAMAIGTGSSALALGVADVTTIIEFGNGLAWIVQFFAAMLYIQWLARRIPDTKLYADARRFMWLGPVLYVVGAFCLMLGPLIALILYLVMLFTLRKHLTTILHRLGAI